MQEDGIHPSLEAQARLLENVWPALQTTLKTR
jgi:lysophospholipase L1-like esterase